MSQQDKLLRIGKLGQDMPGKRKKSPQHSTMKLKTVIGTRKLKQVQMWFNVFWSGDVRIGCYA